MVSICESEMRFYLQRSCRIIQSTDFSFVDVHFSRLIVAEMFEGKYVATAMSLCCQLNWACNFIIGLVFPYMNQYLGAYSFGPFAIVLAMAFSYSLWVLPETQGTKPEDLIAEMVSRNSQSIVYEATATVVEHDPSALNREWRKAMNQLVEEEANQMKDGAYGKCFLKGSFESEWVELYTCLTTILVKICLLSS